MSRAADFRYCAERDSDHGRLRDLSDRWLDRYEIVVTREDGVRGQPVMALALNYPETCPIAPELDFRLKYWVVDHGKGATRMDVAMVGTTRQAIAAARTAGAGGVWGIVPKGSQLRRGLDGWHERGLFERVDGDAFADMIEASGDDLQASYHRDHVYYIETMARLVRPGGLLPVLESGSP